MKKYLMLILPLFLVSCASTPEKAEEGATAQTPEQSTEQNVEPATPEAESAETAAPGEKAEGLAKAVCTLGKDVRTITSNKMETGGCEGAARECTI